MTTGDRFKLSDFEGIPSDPIDEDESQWTIHIARDFLELPEPSEVELLGPLVQRGARTLVGGDSGHGKTTLVYAMTAAVLKGDELLGYMGASEGPALIIDLEQGVRSIKRSIRYAGLEQCDAHLLALPDGLALDRNPDELERLEHVIVALHPVLVVLDPYYKAHRGDANEERGVTDLMRNLDRLRTDYSFALLMPAHVRKEQQTSEPRKLTLADIAGSGALTRGAEIVIALERLAHGHARLRFLKDRDGDLPVGDALSLTYASESGFELVETPQEQSIEQQILDFGESEWMTTREWAGELELRHVEVKRVLERLAATSQIAFMVGPPGRSAKARCYSTAGVPLFGEQPGTAGTLDPSSSTGPGVPDPPLKEGVEGTEDGSRNVPFPSDDPWSF